VGLRASLDRFGEEKISSPLGFESWTVRPTLSRYTDCAILANLKHYGLYRGKGKAIPLQAWSGPEGSRRLRLPDFKTIGT